ncbi:hypothetical protein L1887_56969 [Cichorium endivia]|nr:hypothetical protein L1887_56969 [Cichorium endivia]
MREMHETQERQRAGTALLLFCMFPPHLAVCTQVATGVNTDMPGSREAGKEKSKLQRRVCACLSACLPAGATTLRSLARVLSAAHTTRWPARSVFSSPMRLDCAPRDLARPVEDVLTVPQCPPQDDAQLDRPFNFRR